MKNKKILSVIAVSALLLGTGLTSCAAECPQCQECPEPSCPDVPPKIEEIHHYGVSVTATIGGTITPSTKTAKEGEDVTFTIAPEAHHSLSSLKVNGEEQVSKVTDNKLAAKMGKEGLNVEATFIKASYAVVIEPAENGVIVSNKEGGEFGEEVILTVTANKGHVLEKFLVNGEDKTADLIEGKYKTTIGEAGIKASATFKALAKEELISEFEAIGKKAIAAEVSGEVVKATFSNKSPIGTSLYEFEQFVSADEGKYGIVTESRKDKTDTFTSKTVSKNTVKGEKLYTVKQTYGVKDGVIDTKPNSTSVSSSRAYNSWIPNGGDGYLGINYFAGYDAKFSTANLNKAKDLKFAFNDKVTTISYSELLVNSFTQQKTYTTYVGEFTFEGDKVTHALFTQSKYFNDQFKEEADGTITLIPDETTGENPVGEDTIKELTLAYGEAGSESPEKALPKYSDFMTKTIKTSAVEVVSKPDFTQEEVPLADTSSLVVGHSYKIKVTPEEGKEIGDLSIEVNGFGGADASLVNANFSSWDKTINLTSQGTFNGTITIKGYHINETINVTFESAKLTKLELGATNYSTGKLDTSTTILPGETVDLSILANDPGCDLTVAFQLTSSTPAALEGCKVVPSQYGFGYEFISGKNAGVIEIRAISATDSSIISNVFTVTIEEGSKFDIVTGLPGTYMSSPESVATLKGNLVIKDLVETGLGEYNAKYTYEGKEATLNVFNDGVGNFQISFGGNGIPMTIYPDTSDVTYVYNVLGFSIQANKVTQGYKVALNATMVFSENEKAPAVDTLILEKTTF